MRIPIFILFGAALLSGAEYFPLHPGNEWTYQNELTGSTTMIRVGSTPLATQDGRLFHRLTGYTAEPLWVRNGAEGKLIRYDDETGEDRILTDFTNDFVLEYRPCSGVGRPEDRGADYKGPAGEFQGVRNISFQTSCADAGLLQEVFAANIGMLERTEQTIAGPKSVKLIAARVGNLTLGGLNGSLFQVQLHRKDAVTLQAKLHLHAGPAPFRISFPSGQNYEVLLRDPDGELVWKWSEGQAFLQVVRELEVPSSGLRYTVDIPLALPLPRPWKDGVYTVEAWLTTGPSSREFAGSARISL